MTGSAGESANGAEKALDLPSAGNSRESAWLPLALLPGELTSGELRLWSEQDPLTPEAGLLQRLWYALWQWHRGSLCETDRSCVRRISTLSDDFWKRSANGMAPFRKFSGLCDCRSCCRRCQESFQEARHLNGMRGAYGWYH